MTTERSDGEPLLTLRGVSKRFGPIDVLRGVDLEIGASEAVGLIGDNGAGKSTLVKILSGVHEPSGGEITLDGQAVRFSNPLESRKCGIELIYQDLALCDDLDTTANVFLGREPLHRMGPIRLLDRSSMRRGTKAILDELGADFSATQRVDTLSGGQRQLVAVARALRFSPRILLMDEPTASLSNQKVHALLEIVERLKKRGVAVLLISHRFVDIVQLCDRIVALRDGRITYETRPQGKRPSDVIARMQEALSGETLQGEV